MPPKKKKNRNFSKKNSSNPSGSKEVLFADDDQMYAIVECALGDRRFTVICSDGKNRLGKLRGSIRRSNFVRKGSYVLISCRPEDTKVDIIHLYCETHASLLYKYNELDWVHSKSHLVVDGIEQDTEDDFVVFEGDDDSFIDGL